MEEKSLYVLEVFVCFVVFCYGKSWNLYILLKYFFYPLSEPVVEAEKWSEPQAEPEPQAETPKETESAAETQGERTHTGAQNRQKR